MELVLGWPGCNFGEATQTTGEAGSEPLNEKERGKRKRERERGADDEDVAMKREVKAWPVSEEKEPSCNNIGPFWNARGESRFSA